jgi:DNA invertase Pin-like site-specific DNA recombinase
MSPKSKPPKRRIGYARVSTEAQDLTREQKALKRAGYDPVFSDKASGKSMAGRPALAEALAELDADDELVIAEWDRATRSMWDGLQIIEAVIDARASIKVLDRGYIDLATPMGRAFMAMLSSLAEDERLRISSAPTKAERSRRRRASAWDASRSLRRSKWTRRGGGSPRARNRRATSPRATVSASARFRG